MILINHEQNSWNRSSMNKVTPHIGRMDKEQNPSANGG